MTNDRLCPDCGAAVGEKHHENCDVARCLVTGGQRLMHALLLERERLHGGVGCGEDVWTGEWPGVAECEQFGLYAKMIPGQGWVPCSKDDEGAQADLNTLVASGRFEWNRAQLRWVETGKDRT